MSMQELRDRYAKAKAYASALNAEVAIAQDAYDEAEATLQLKLDECRSANARALLLQDAVEAAEEV